MHKQDCGQQKKKGEASSSEGESAAGAVAAAATATAAAAAPAAGPAASGPAPESASPSAVSGPPRYSSGRSRPGPGGPGGGSNNAIAEQKYFLPEPRRRRDSSPEMGGEEIGKLQDTHSRLKSNYNALRGLYAPTDDRYAEFLDAAYDLFNSHLGFYELEDCELVLNDVFATSLHCGLSWKMKALQARAFLRFKQHRFVDSLQDFLDFKKVAGPSPQLAENMGHVFNSLGLHAAAEKSFVESLELMSLPDAHPMSSDNKGGVLLGLGIVKSRLKKHHEAREKIEEALEFYRTKFAGRDHSLIAKTLTSLGKTNVDLRDYVRAEEAFREAVRVFKFTCGDDTPLTAGAIHNHAQSLRDIGGTESLQKALKGLQEALHIYINLDSLHVYFGVIGEILEDYRGILHTLHQHLDEPLRRAKLAIGVQPVLPPIEKFLKAVLAQKLPEDAHPAYFYKSAVATYLLADDRERALGLIKQAQGLASQGQTRSRADAELTEFIKLLSSDDEVPLEILVQVRKEDDEDGESPAESKGPASTSSGGNEGKAESKAAESKAAESKAESKSAESSIDKRPFRDFGNNDNRTSNRFIADDRETEAPRERRSDSKKRDSKKGNTNKPVTDWRKDEELSVEAQQLLAMLEKRKQRDEDNEEGEEFAESREKHNIIAKRYVELKAKYPVSDIRVMEAGLDLFNSHITFYELEACESVLGDVFDSCEKYGGQYYLRAVQARAFLRYKQHRFKECLEDFKAFKGQAGVSAELAENMGHAHNALGQYTEAEECFRDALKILDDPSGPYKSKSSKGGVLLGMGVVMSRLRRFYEARTWIQSALKFYQERFQGKDHSLVAKTLMSLGQAEIDLNEPSRAEDAYRQAVRIFKYTCGQNTPLTANALHNLARTLMILQQQPKVLEASKLFVEALDIYVHLDTLQVYLGTIVEIQREGREAVMAAADKKEGLQALYNMFKPFVPLLQHCDEQMQIQRIPQDGTAAVFYKYAGELCMLAGANEPSRPFLTKAIDLLQKERSVDCSNLIRECRELLQFSFSVKPAEPSPPPRTRSERSSAASSGDHKGKKIPLHPNVAAGGVTAGSPAPAPALDPAPAPALLASTTAPVLPNSTSALLNSTKLPGAVSPPVPTEETAPATPAQEEQIQLQEQRQSQEAAEVPETENKGEVEQKEERGQRKAQTGQGRGSNKAGQSQPEARRNSRGGQASKKQSNKTAGKKQSNK